MDPTFFGPNMDPKFLQSQKFFTQIFRTHNFFKQKFFLNTIFFPSTIFLDTKFLTQNHLDKFFFYQKFIDLETTSTRDIGLSLTKLNTLD